MAGDYSFVFFERRRIDRTLTWKRAGEPVPFGTGWAARMECRDRAGGRTMTTFSTSDGSLALGATDGTIHMVKSSASTTWTGWRHGVYELVLTDPSGQDLEPLLRGSFRVEPAVTL